MIKRYCDGCGKELTDKFVSEIKIQSSYSDNDYLWRGECCIKCLMALIVQRAKIMATIGDR